MKKKIFRESEVSNTTVFFRWFFTQQEAGAKIEKQQEQMKSPTLKTPGLHNKLNKPHKMTEFEDVERSCRKEF